MGSRTVRLDDDTKKVLARLRRLTGLSISEVLRRGLSTYEQVARDALSVRPYDIYARLEQGCGGGVVAPARKAKRAIRAAVSARLPRQRRFRDYVREKRRW